jgi:hypothetical protein
LVNHPSKHDVAIELIESPVSACTTYFSSEQ